MVALQTVEQPVTEIHQLTTDQKRLLREALDQMLANELERCLLAKGVISSLPSRNIDVAAHRRWRAVNVKGKPVSETLIEDRR